MAKHRQSFNQILYDHKNQIDAPKNWLIDIGLQVARRRMQEEAAERRRQESENRGIKDPEKVRRQQQRAADMERAEEDAAKQGPGNPSLRVSWIDTNYESSITYSISV